MENKKAKEIKITNINDLKEYSRGIVVEFPPFAEDQPFYARLRRPSMLEMVKNGQIPNELLGAANDLFVGSFEAKENDSMKTLFEVLDTIAKASFMEPTFEEIKESGISLTDDQYMFLFNYVQKGPRALNSFRKK